MDSIIAKDYKILFNDEAYRGLNSYLEQNNPSLIVILVDTNTHQHCLTRLLSKMQSSVSIEVIEVEAGEEYKTVETCVGVWNSLSEMGADRKSLILNLGGGVITDLGGFIACTFRRGITYINIPTSLLAMVDASVGGKTGVDLGSLKNQIGVIKSGDLVLVDTSYLDTLPQNHLKSGLSEMLKHGLIYDRQYWDRMRNLSELNLEDLDELIRESILIKFDIVSKDPFENGIRKALNYGHTLGHAIESYYLDNDSEHALLHGEAIAIGMILESYISMKLLHFPESDLEDITATFTHIFKKKTISVDDRAQIIELLKFDKKNERGNVNFVLLETIGKPQINKLVKNSLIEEAFEYYEGLL